MKNKSKSLVGSFVRVITPKIFNRCGYPMSLEKTSSNIDHDLGIIGNYAKLQDHLASIGITRSFNTFYGKIRKQYLQACALMLMEQYSYGGHQRSVYEEDCADLHNQIYMVQDVSYCVTGFYRRGSSWGDDPEPSQLINQQRHTILTVVKDCELIKIRKCNVEVLPPIVSDNFVKGVNKDLL